MGEDIVQVRGRTPMLLFRFKHEIPRYGVPTPAQLTWQRHMFMFFSVSVCRDLDTKSYCIAHRAWPSCLVSPPEIRIIHPSPSRPVARVHSQRVPSKLLLQSIPASQT